MGNHFHLAADLEGVLDPSLHGSRENDHAAEEHCDRDFDGTVDFDPGPDVFNLTTAGIEDIFVSKLDRNGNFVWARQMGGTGDDGIHNLAVDSSGNVYTSGFFEGTADFDPGPGVFNLTSAGSFEFFVSKLDRDGNFVWARQSDGFNHVDGGGNVYASGTFEGTVDFDPGPGVFELTSAGDGDIVVSKLDSAGNFVWARQMGVLGFASGNGVAVDGTGNVYATGSFEGTVDFDPGPGVFNLTSAGDRDIYVSKLDSAGNFVWTRQMGGFAVGYDVAVDGTGNVYTTGYFAGTADFDPGPGVFNMTAAGYVDVFVSKLDGDGNFVWARQMGGLGSSSGSTSGNGVAVDGSGNVYTVGEFDSTADFDPGPGVFELTPRDNADNRFVSKLDSAGNFVWAQQAGTEGLRDIAVDVGGNVYATGYFRDTFDFDPGAGVFNLTSAGGSDIFVAKYNDQSSAGQSPAISEGGIVLSTLLPTVNTVSPLSIISVFGEGFSTDAILFPNLDGNGDLDTILGGTCLMMNGEALPIFAITPGQINAQASAAKALGPASFDDGLIAARFNADAVAVAPDGMLVDQYGTSRPAKPGDIIVLYGTGWGETTAALGTGELATGVAELLPSANPMVSFGGIPMAPEDVFYVGVTPNTAGLYQLAIRVPAIAMPGRNQVVLTVYGKSTPVGPVIPVAAPLFWCAARIIGIAEFRIGRRSQMGPELRKL